MSLKSALLSRMLKNTVIAQNIATDLSGSSLQKRTS